MLGMGNGGRGRGQLRRRWKDGEMWSKSSPGGVSMEQGDNVKGILYNRGRQNESNKNEIPHESHQLGY